MQFKNATTKYTYKKKAFIIKSHCIEKVNKRQNIYN